MNEPKKQLTLEDLSKQVDDKMDGMSTRIDGLAKQVDDKMDGISGRIDGLAKQMDDKIENLSTKMDKKIEDLANEAVKKDYKVTKEEMAYEDAIKSGALAFFKLKYPNRVNVYSVGDFSKELCGGPHVSHTAEIGKIKITKEEAVSAGVRRIRAVVEE